MQLRKHAGTHLLAALTLVSGLSVATIAAAEKKAAAPPPSAPDPAMVTRFYDIHAWTMPTFDFSLDSSAHSAAFVTPANIQNGTFDYRLTGPRFANRSERSTPSREEKVDALVKLIVLTVAPESWRDAGGKASIGDLRDVLVIRQTPENQAEIAGLLQGLKDHQGETVRTVADWFILSSDEAEKLRKSGAVNGVSLPPPAIDLAALTKLSPPVPHFHAELLCLNGQKVSYISGRERSVLANQTVTVTGTDATVTPFMANAGAGIALEINPVIEREAKRAVITLFSTYTDPENPGAPVPVRTVVNLGGLNPKGASAGGITHAENDVVHEFRSTVRLALATPVIAGSMTLEPTAKKPGEAKELVLILRVEPVE